MEQVEMRLNLNKLKLSLEKSKYMINEKQSNPATTTANIGNNTFSD